MMLFMIVLMLLPAEFKYVWYDFTLSSVDGTGTMWADPIGTVSARLMMRLMMRLSSIRNLGSSFLADQSSYFINLPLISPSAVS